MTYALKPYPCYKDSGVPWLGTIPERWEVQRVKRLFRYRKESNARGLEQNVLSLTLRGVVNNDPNNPEGLVPSDYSSYQVFDKSDLVFKLIDLENSRTSRVGLVHERGIMSPAYIRLAQLRQGDIRYFFYLFFDLYLRGVYNQLGAGVRSTLGPNDLLNLQILSPGSSEQSAIVRFLDYADRRIGRYLRAKQKLIKLLEEQKQAVIHRAVARGLDPNVSLKPSGAEWLGDVPEHWEVKKLRLLFRYAKGRRAAELTNEYIGQHPGSFPVYSGQTESHGLMGHIDLYEFEFSEPVVFVTTVGARAMTTRLVSGRFSLSQNCALIIPRRSDTKPAFFEPVLQRLFDYEKASISLIMQPSLRFGDLNRFYVPCPPESEQAAIASAIAKGVSELGGAMDHARREISLLREYRTRLIADVVTGKFDVREVAAHLPDEADEPGEDLLDETLKGGDESELAPDDLGEEEVVA